jgi:hypothetical protein
VPAEVAGFLRDDPPAGQSLGALMVAGIAGGGGGGADPLSDGVSGGALPTRTLWIAGADGTVLRGLQADAPGRLRTGTFWQATQPVSGTVTATATKPGTATQTSVASTVTTNTTLLAANAARLGASIYNESTSVLFILLGAGTESATVYTLQMAAGAYYEVPNAFTGIIKGHWVTANGSARVTELT